MLRTEEWKHGARRIGKKQETTGSGAASKERPSSPFPGISFDLELGADGTARVLDVGPLPDPITRMSPDPVTALRSLLEEHWNRLIRLAENTIATGIPGAADIPLDVSREHKEEPRWFMLSTSPDLSNPGSGKIHALLLDIHHEHAASEDLVRAKEAAEQANRTKTEFLANISHELRTPLNGIIGMTDLLLETELSSEQAEFARTVKISSDSLVAIINDILDLSRIEEGKLITIDKSSLNLYCLVRSVCETLLPAAESAGLDLLFCYDPGLPLEFLADNARLKQILYNLVGNAVKFTPNGYIMVKVEAGDPRHTRGGIRFSVMDTGIGIPEDKHELIFEKFSQVDASITRRYGGAGLGLPISRSLIEVMGGTLNLESREGEGSRFTFTIPLDSAPGSALFGELLDLNQARIALLCKNRRTEKLYASYFRAWKGSPVILNKNELSREKWTLLLTDLAAEELEALMPGLSEAEILIIIADIRSIHTYGKIGLKNSIITNPPFDLLRIVESLTGEKASKTFLSSRASDSPQTFRRILIAEDNEINQDVLSKILERFGCSVTLANDGDQAHRIWSRSTFDAIFMDCQMPGVDGLEATLRIRSEEPEDQHVPIIALTGHAMPGDRERFLSVGMDDYLSKPVSAADLKEALERWTRQAAEKTS